MRQKIAKRQRGSDDLSFLLEVQVIQTVAPLRSSDDSDRLGGMVMVMVLLVQIVLRGEVVGLLVGALVTRTGDQVDTADADRHRRRAILETAALLPPPGAQDRDQTRQGSYLVLASRDILTTARSRGRLASLVASGQLHGFDFKSCWLLDENKSLERW